MSTPILDDDMFVGKKRIMLWLKIENWSSVVKMKEKDGLPIAKIGGQWRSSRKRLQEWFDKKLDCKHT